MASSKKTEYEIALLVGGKVQASFGNSIKDVNNNLDSMANMAKSAAKMVTTAFAAVQVGQFVSDAVEAYSTFEQAMAMTAAGANATAAEYERLEAAALEMGAATTKTAEDAANALGYMALAGWSVDESIAGLEPVLRLSEATQMDLALCSSLVTDSMSALGLEVDALSGYLDICIKAANETNVDAEQLMESLIGAGGAARTAGIDMMDTATAIGILANNGTKGAEAGTALNSMFVRLSSKDVAINAMKKLGVSVYDASGNFIGLQETLVALSKAMEDLSTEEKTHYMSQIAGTNYYSEMSYLLDAVTESADGTASAWDELSASLNNSEGALMDMAAVTTDTLNVAFEILDSAVEDAQIRFTDAFGDDLKDMILNLANFIPTLTDNFVKFADKAGPKISKTFNTIQKGAGKVWDVMVGFGEGFIENFETVEMVIAGIGGAIIAYKVVSGLVSTATAIKGVATAIKAMTITNPWLLGITAAISAIVGITAAVKTAEKQAVKSNLAKHFGDIALSMDEISAAAEFIVASDNLNKIHESMAAFDELDGIQDSMQESIDAINKMNWKVSIGMELTADDKESYIAEIQNYVAEAQNYVQQAQYALNINLSLFAEGDLERQNIVDQLNTFYSDKYAELEALGTQLNQTVTDAFADGLLEMDEVKEITELQSQMARIQEAIATSDFDAQLKVMELQYSGADLDADSFKALQEELAAQVETASAEYEESLQLRIANYEVMLDDGAITQAQYDAAIEEFWEDYMTSMTELEAKALSFQTNTIMQVYSDDVEAFNQHMSDVMKEYTSEAYAWDWEERPVIMWDGMAQEIWSSDIDKDTKQAIAELLETMQPSLEQVEELKQQYTDLGLEIPAALNQALADADTLGAMTVYQKMWGQAGDMQALYDAMAQEIVNDESFAEIEASLREKGWEMPEAFAEEIATAQTETLPPVFDGMYAYSSEYLDNLFSQGFDVSADVNVTLNPIYNNPLLNTPTWRYNNLNNSLPGHADGGIFDTPHLAWFAEDGPEAAIPLDGSSNAISLWERVGRLLGVFDGGMISSKGAELYNGITNYETTNNNTTNESTDSKQFVFSPQITIEGSASREDVDNALSLSMEQFRELMEQYIAEKDRVSFA